VRGDSLDRLGIIEIVREFGAGLFLALDDLGTQLGVLPQVVAQPAHQVGLLREILHQNVACAFQCGLGVRHPLTGIGEIDGGIFRYCGRISHELLGQGLQPGLARDLSPSPALGTVR
jgi:hypothetical protein